MQYEMMLEYLKCNEEEDIAMDKEVPITFKDVPIGQRFRWQHWQLSGHCVTYRKLSATKAVSVWGGIVIKVARDAVVESAKEE